MSSKPVSASEIHKIQTAQITDEMIASARELIGVWLRRDVHWPAISEPVSQHDIRRWALYSVGDDNPIWSDSEYGRRTVWGGVIAPPTFPFTFDSTIVAPGLRGVQWILGGSRWELFLPIRVGDQITARARLLDVVEKEGRNASRFVVQTGEVIFTNLRNEIVGRAETDILRIPRAGSGQGLRYEKKKADGDAGRPRVSYSPEEIDVIRRAYLEEEVRGAEVRYWDDTQEGEVLPPIVKGPLTLVDIVAFYAGRRSVYNPLKLAFLERERHPANVYLMPETGIPVHPAAGHFDAEIATRVGFPGAYDNGWQRMAWLGHLVTNWASDWGFVRRLSARLVKPVIVGDVTWCRGTVSRRYVENGEHLVDVECMGENQDGVTVMTGTASVRLPSRARDDVYGFAPARLENA
jgi:acyl dehydratase